MLTESIFLHFISHLTHSHQPIIFFLCIYNFIATLLQLILFGFQAVYAVQSWIDNVPCVSAYALFSVSFYKVVRRGRRLNCARQLQNLDGTFLNTITTTESGDGTCSYRLHIVGDGLIPAGINYSGSQKNMAYIEKCVVKYISFSLGT